jgi:crotonobetainyl-CoA:carnitine CoA-transferase CaiB-like acyl-CoA transferase
MTFKPLANVRILDFTHVIAGPLATFHLAQLGAEVTKIENRQGGDVMRRGKGHVNFLAMNAGKHSVPLDLGDPGDYARVLELARETDVLVDSLRPGVLDRFGLSDEALRALNPRLVYCSISGWGCTGDWCHRPAYDHVVQAATGMTLLAGREGDPPVKTGFPVIDAGTGIIAAMAIVAALRERDATNRGCYLDVSMAGAALQLMYPFACEALTTGAVPQRVGNRGYSGSPASDFFMARDGWVAVGANTPRQLVSLLKVLKRTAIVYDKRYFKAPPDLKAPVEFVRSHNPDGLREVLASAIREWQTTNLEAACAAEGVACAAVRTLAGFANLALANGMFEAMEFPDAACNVRSPGLGYRAYPSRSVARSPKHAGTVKHRVE